MSLSIINLYPIYIEWLGARPSLKRRERREFARWIIRVHPELAEPYRLRPAEFRLMCQEIQRGGRAAAQNGIGDATLRRYAPALTKLYLLQPEPERGTFQDFLNAVLQECRTERALKRFLEDRTPSSPVPSKR